MKKDEYNKNYYYEKSKEKWKKKLHLMINEKLK